MKMIIAAAALFAVQTAPAQPTALKDTQPVMTLTGCVSRDAATGSYTFSDPKTGAKYRLSGLDPDKGSKTRGEIVVGTGARRVTIRGGLVPSANVAAQAGAIDPSRAAIASAPGGGGSVQLPEFHAARVQGASGTCP
jgi:hypothetical protein